MSGTVQQHAEACDVDEVNFLAFIVSSGEGPPKGWLTRHTPQASRRRFEKRNPPLKFIGNPDYAIKQ